MSFYMNNIASLLFPSLCSWADLAAGLVFPILPSLGLEFGIPSFMIGMILSSNRIARIFFNLPAGRMFTIVGVKLTLSLATLLETVAVWLRMYENQHPHP